MHRGTLAVSLGCLLKMSFHESLLEELCFND